MIKGTLEHFIDFDTTLLSAPFVSFIAKGKNHHIKPIDDGKSCDGFVIRFQSEFVSETIFQLYQFFHDDANITFSTPREFERFVVLCEMLDDEVKQDSPDYSIIRSMLGTLLTILDSEQRKPSDAQSKYRQNNSFIKFLQLLEENYRKPHGVSFYAEKLQMSSRIPPKAEWKNDNGKF